MFSNLQKFMLVTLFSCSAAADQETLELDVPLQEEQYNALAMRIENSPRIQVGHLKNPEKVSNCINDVYALADRGLQLVGVCMKDDLPLARVVCSNQIILLGNTAFFRPVCTMQDVRGINLRPTI